MADFGQFYPVRITYEERKIIRQEALDFYRDAPRIITTPCGAIASIDMDGTGYRCHNCFAVVGSAGCPCR